MHTTVFGDVVRNKKILYFHVSHYLILQKMYFMKYASQ